MGFKEDISSDFSAERFGLVSGSASNTLFPNVPAKLARFVAYSGNITSFYIGKSGQVTYELPPGVDTGWFPVVEDNLNTMQFRNSSGTVDKLGFWVQF